MCACTKFEDELPHALGRYGSLGRSGRARAAGHCNGARPATATGAQTDMEPGTDTRGAADRGNAYLFERTKELRSIRSALASPDLADVEAIRRRLHVRLKPGMHAGRENGQDSEHDAEAPHASPNVRNLVVKHT